MPGFRQSPNWRRASLIEELRAGFKLGKKPPWFEVYRAISKRQIGRQLQPMLLLPVVFEQR